MSSPRSWGCFPGLVKRRKNESGLPHARGGVSPSPSPDRQRPGSSPRSWGCFCGLALRDWRAVVFPTLVGVFLSGRPSEVPLPGLPHARGGVSIEISLPSGQDASSPRSWGCFRQRQTPGGLPSVFPTLVGVFLSSAAPSPVPTRLPHARGGVSARRRSPPGAW